jgi:quercetin dioxygenase-like cupin family protein
METQRCIDSLDKGNLYLIESTEANRSKGWNPHPKYAGVSMKHIITGVQSDNKLSSHVVRIDPNCTLEEHFHEGKTELHEVISGNGYCMLNGEKINYQTGDCALIPENVPHLVKAGEEGLILLAKFIPALL